MIVTKLLGGLGNQMFQYAAGLSLAQQRRTALRVDITALRSYDRHQGYQLDRIFEGRFRTASRWDLLWVLGFDHEKTLRLPTRIDPTWRPKRGDPVILQPSQNYWPGIREVPRNAYLAGYWQSSKYFGSAADAVRSAFRFSAPLKGRNADLADEMSSTTSVSLHVRRGDYVTNPGALAFHGLCDADYYKAAMSRLERHVENPSYFVFSDDPEAARALVGDSARITVISHNSGEHSYRDMQLMTCCKHHILANSSFSWWGAWLARAPGQIVIAPKRWFAGSPEEMSDIFEPDWITL